LGVAILPRASTPSPDNVEIAVDDDHLVRTIAIGWMANRFLAPSAASFRDSALLGDAHAEHVTTSRNRFSAHVALMREGRSGEPR
jgi:hypothetical protein